MCHAARDAMRDAARDAAQRFPSKIIHHDFFGKRGQTPNRVASDNQRCAVGRERGTDPKPGTLRAV